MSSYCDYSCSCIDDRCNKKHIITTKKTRVELSKFINNIDHILTRDKNIHCDCCVNGILCNEKTCDCYHTYNYESRKIIISYYNSIISGKKVSYTVYKV